MTAINVVVPASFDWYSLILIPILAAVLIAILITTSLTMPITYKIFAIAMSILIVAVLIYGIANSVINASKQTISTVPQEVLATEDPFTYDPGETANGTVIFDGNAADLPTQFNCNLKSANTVYQDGKCNCKTGYYGRLCQYQGFDESYVSLTTSTVPTATTGISFPTPTLSSWPTASTVSGCTNLCTSNPVCVAVTYANGICTPYTSLSFPKAPIQNTTIDPPVLDTTLYINKSRLISVNLQGYFNIIFGNIPLRYFVGNDVASGTNTNIHVTRDGTRIGYYVAGVTTNFTGIPDWIIVGTSGTLYISTARIPDRANIVPGQSNPVSFSTPLILPKQNFPFTQTTLAYWIRLDTP